MAITRDIGLSKMMNARIEQSGSLTPSVPASDNFQETLKSLMSGIRVTDKSTITQSSISPEQMMLLVRAIQMQMNARLYNTVFNNGLENNYLAATVIQNFGGHIAVSGADTSNNRQILPKKTQADPDSGIDQIIQDAAKQFDVDAKLIRSVIKAESNFNSDAQSPKGAMGLMQLMPETARELGVQNAYDPRENVMGGTRYLKMLLNRYNGQVDLALAAYNWGMGNLEKRPHNLPQETLQYVARVNSYYKAGRA